MFRTRRGCSRSIWVTGPATDDAPRGGAIDGASARTTPSPDSRTAPSRISAPQWPRRAGSTIRRRHFRSAVTPVAGDCFSKARHGESVRLADADMPSLPKVFSPGRSTLPIIGAAVNYARMNKGERISRFVRELGGESGDRPNIAIVDHPNYRASFSCWNEQRYYEAHDVLEQLWLNKNEIAACRKLNLCCP